MGCDIHAYIEYKMFDQNDGTPYYNCFGERISDRDYVMFGILAGVRRDGCIFEPRGLPEHVSMVVRWDFNLFITETGEGSDCTTRENAERWVQEGSSKWSDDEHNLVTNPDWRTPSWLNQYEFEQCLNSRKNIKDYGDVDPQWDAILAAMKVLPSSRLVFWFDN